MVVNPGQSMATISESRDEQNSTITSWYMQSASKTGNQSEVAEMNSELIERGTPQTMKNKEEG